MTRFSACVFSLFSLFVLGIFFAAKVFAQQTIPVWSPVSNLSSGFNVMIEDNQNLMIGTDAGVFISTDNGINWVKRSNNLVQNINGSIVALKVTDLKKIGITIFAATEKGIWKTVDDGGNWVNISNEILSDQMIYRLLVNNGVLFVSAYSSTDNIYKIYSSSDFGQTWEEKTSGLPTDFHNYIGTNFVLIGNTFFVLVANNLYALSDKDWLIKLLPKSSGGFFSIASTDSVLYIIETNALWRSGNKTQSWEKLNVPIDSYQIFTQGNHLMLYRNSFIGGGTGIAYASSLYYSSDSGKTFTSNIAKSFAHSNSNFLTSIAYAKNSFFIYNAAPLGFLGTEEASIFRSNSITQIATTVSAADYQINALASESVASVFGSGLALTTATATSGALPTSLENTSVTLTDSAGNVKTAPLFYVSPTQINFQVPAGLANGVGTIAINLYNQVVATGVVAITNTAPSIFSANQTGTGLAAANVQRVKADGTSSFEPTAQFNTTTQQFVGVPINVNTGVDQPYLNLYGTGIRGRSDLANVKATIGGVEVPVTYAGAHGFFTGVDQVNILLPASLAGKGEVALVLTVDNQVANAVKIVIQ